MLLLYSLHTLFWSKSSLGTQSGIIYTIHHFYSHGSFYVSFKYQQCLHGFSFGNIFYTFFHLQLQSPTSGNKRTNKLHKKK